MAIKFIFLFAFILIKIKAKDESLKVYREFNGFETIQNDQNFIIETEYKSIAYFDSFDKGSVVYISKDYENFKAKKDERITGKFYEIEPNTKYYVRNNLYYSPSVFKKYLLYIV